MGSKLSSAYVVTWALPWASDPIGLAMQSKDSVIEDAEYLVYLASVVLKCGREMINRTVSG